ncbi:hypothetical protein Q5N47_18215, partial [Vibrio cholerae]|nr:hypothetical protein [Vibrio cholerae]
SHNGQGTDIYNFIERDGYLESDTCIEVSDAISVKLVIWHHDHTHDFDVHFIAGSHSGSETNEYQDVLVPTRSDTSI